VRRQVLDLPPRHRLDVAIRIGARRAPPHLWFIGVSLVASAVLSSTTLARKCWQPDRVQSQLQMSCRTREVFTVNMTSRAGLPDRPLKRRLIGRTKPPRWVTRRCRSPLRTRARHRPWRSAEPETTRSTSGYGCTARPGGRRRQRGRRRPGRDRRDVAAPRRTGPGHSRKCRSAGPKRCQKYSGPPKLARRAPFHRRDTRAEKSQNGHSRSAPDPARPSVHPMGPRRRSWSSGSRYVLLRRFCRRHNSKIAAGLRARGRHSSTSEAGRRRRNGPGER